jgi:phosphatidylglycerophosphatase C
LNLALFDFDGTITTIGTYPGFLRFAVDHKRALIGGFFLSPLIFGYKVGLIPDRVIRLVLTRASFQGDSAARIREAGWEYARDALPAVLRQEAVDRINWHKTKGDRVVVVSASLDVYLHHWCTKMGIDVICSELEEKGGRLTGRYVGRDCCGAEKLRRIRERYDVSRYATIYAYGDSDEDLDMLSLAQEKYFQWKKID